MNGYEVEDSKQSPADVSNVVQNLLLQMQSKFRKMSDTILEKIDVMGNRINELEEGVNKLRAEVGVEGSPSPLAPSKQNLDEVKQEDDGTLQD